MHELSIAQHLLDLALSHAALYPAQRVVALNLRIGLLREIREDSLRLNFELLAEGTPLESAELRIELLPVVVYCSRCDAKQQLPSLQSFRCPACGEPTADIRQGQELDLHSLTLAARSDS